MAHKKIDLNIISSLREGFIVSWRERHFVFNLALLPVLLIGLLDTVVFRLSAINADHDLGIFVSTLSQWLVSVPFVAGWILFLHGNITRKQSIIDVFKKINILRRFVWRSLVFGFMLSLAYGVLAALLLLAQNTVRPNLGDARTMFLLLTPLVFVAPFFFLSLIDFVLNKQFQPIKLLQHSFHSYGKIFSTLWLLAFIFLGIMSGLSIILSMFFGVFEVDNPAMLAQIIDSSMALSFALSILSNMLFFWFATCAYNIAYRYWENLN
ncbi:MAG: hypothetical protein QM529_06685 [Hydrotalea sp.]|nr:hypothetical protein [Hydrotalea sp.]